ncbi:MAG: GDP-L-fucose synthase [Humidesulfovibrio sp.]|uniref:GDP-L-fucose synthase family protein n=1 Tax=Humidesulfovibrio sp. TaxID=2910988 RepID=UPI0027354EF3|nr:GDP-L-fucose synthase [Humidesulfovibrio sp.]MDP2847928.1 GDP-L-fucose synthase [Humidesulfovibrio sp.]
MSSVSRKVFVAGGSKALGSAILRAFAAAGQAGFAGVGDSEPDLRDQQAVDAFFEAERPDWVVYAAGKAGGIGLNRRAPADLILDNLLCATHVIHAAQRFGAQKLLYLASSCVYPKDAAQPIRENSMYSGPLEPTNLAYASAKLAGLELCRAMRQQFGVDFNIAVPTNYFGPGDDFSPENSHVVGALMARMRSARAVGDPELSIWGTGKARREFLYVDDVAHAAVFLMQGHSWDGPLNIGSGSAVSIAELSQMLKEITGYAGQLTYDVTKPDGMPVKVLDSSRLAGLGWAPRVDFAQGLRLTYDWYLNQK